MHIDPTGRVRAVLVLLLGLLSAVGASAQERCATARVDSVLERHVPGWGRSRQKLEALVQEQVRLRAGNLRLADVNAAVIRIPVVVHVVHHNAANTVGGPDNGNIADDQIASQIRVLNEDYRRMPGTNGFNTNPVGADMEIEFYLATSDPNGNPTNGITRHYSDRTDYDALSYSDADALAAISSWPTDKYLNIWVTTLGAGGYLGIAQYPSAGGIPGLDASEESRSATDGVIIDHRAFGRNTGTANSGIYKEGRTATHEIGHWLGLIHTWGDAVCGDDYCDDTPWTEKANRTRNCGPMYSNCKGTQTRNMIENYLDYSPDLCMNVFTNDQKNRVRAVLQASPRRWRLVNNLTALPETEALTVSVAPNPVSGGTIELTAQFRGRRLVTISLLDEQGRTVNTQQFTNQPGNQFSVARRGLPVGLYLLRVQADAETAVKRVLLVQ
jgi:hypothetical protein